MATTTQQVHESNTTVVCSADGLTKKGEIIKKKSVAGFECEFLQNPPNVIQAHCPICLQILCEPYQVSCCGYSFCKTCIERIQADKKPCPVCNQETFSSFHNKGLQRLLYQFRVYCTHKQQGCEWTGELGQLDKHLNLNPQPDKQLEGCQYSEIECQFCHNLIQRHTITTHQAECPKRPFCCEYCQNYDSNYDDVIHNHWLVCGFRPVPCPNECGTFPQQQNLQTHITNECPLTVIDCNFHHVGCDVKLFRKDMSTHIKENLVTHTSLHLTSYNRLLESHAELQKSVNTLETENQTLKHQLKLMQEKNQKLQASHSDSYVGMAVPGYVELTMYNYKQLKKNEKGWLSPPFYTHLQGYKMFLRVDANGYGDGKGTHVTLSVHLMRGEFDDGLKWPFRGEITIQLVNQEKDEEHLTVTVHFTENVPNTYTNRVTTSERNLRVGRGFHKYIAHEQVRSKYLKNDCLCFRITRVKLQ